MPRRWLHGLTALVCTSCSSSAPPLSQDANLEDAVAATDGGASDGNVSVVWQQEAPPGSLLIAAGAEISGIVADPVTPRHLMLALADTSSTALPRLAMPWFDGVTGPVLLGTTIGVSTAVHGFGGFTHTGAFFDYLVGGSASTVYVARYAAGTWSWIPIAEIGSTWPPRSVGVAPNATDAAYVVTPKTLIDATSQPPQVAGALRAPIDSITLFPDGQTFLAVSGLNFRDIESCVIGQLDCTTLANDGIPADAQLTKLAIASPDNRVFAMGWRNSSSAVPMTWTAPPGSQVFTPIGLPATAIKGPLAVSPLASTTLAAKTDTALYVSRDLGASWSELALPSPAGLSITAIEFDAGGRLFMYRGHSLYSAQL